MRLDRFIANNSEFSRRDTHKLIKTDRVHVNGELARSPNVKISLEHDIVLLDAEQVTQRRHVYLMLNKPSGYVCASSDAFHPTVVDLVCNLRNCRDLSKPVFEKNDLQIAGRLDVDTTGLVFITTDGKWNHKVTSPAVAGKKVYYVQVAQKLKKADQDLFQAGLLLKGEKKKTKPVTLEIISAFRAKVTLSEGRYHQVKRMFTAVGNQVIGLHRESIAGIMMDSELDEGSYRALSSEELIRIDHALQKNE